MSVNVTGGALDFTASIDTSDFEKQIATIEGDINGVLAESAKLAQSLETIRGKIYARKDLLLTETDIAKIRQYNQEIQALEKEFLKISNIGKTGFDDTGNAIIKQLGLIDQLRAKISDYNKSIGAAQSTGEIGNLVVELKQAEAELTQLTNIGKEGFDSIGNAIIAPLGLIEQMEAKIAGLKSAIGSAQSTGDIAVLTTELQSAESEFTRLTNIGKEGFDNLGNAIIEPTGLMEALILKANDLHLAIVKATSPEEVAVLNAELETTNAELSRMRNAGTAGFDSFGNKLVVEVGLLDQLKIKANELRVALGAATSPDQIAILNAELEATGVEMTRLNNIGKTGFDGLGNAIEKTATKSNLLNKSWSFIRQAAYIIPGIGIAGIFGIITTAVVSLFEAIVKGTDGINKFKLAWKSLNDVVAEANKTAGSQITDLKILYSAATNVNLSMDERLRAVKALKEEFPDYFKKLNDEIILTGQSKQAYDDLTDAIIKSSRAAAAKTKIDDIERQKLDIDFQKQKINTATANEKARAQDKVIAPTTDFRSDATPQAPTTLSKGAQQVIIEQRRLAALSEQDKKQQVLDYQEKFLIAFAGEKSITKVVEDAADKRVKKTKETDKELNDLLRNRLSLQQQIAKLEVGSDQSGLLKDDNEIDKIKQKYQDTFDVIDALNKKIETYNATHAKKIAPISADEIDALKLKEQNELQNKQYEIDANNYKTSLDEKKKLFDNFQQEVNEIGKDKATNIFKNDIGEFTSYTNFLKSELAKLADKTDFGSLLKKQTLTKQLTSSQQSDKDQQQKDFNEAYKAAQTYNQKLQLIDAVYYKQKAALNAQFSGQELADMMANLERNKQASIDAAKDEVFQKTALYQQLNTDVIEMSKKQVKAQIDAIKTILSKGVDLPPELKQQLEKQLADLQSRLKFSSRTNYIKDLEQEKANIDAALKSGMLSTEEFKKQEEHLKNINKQLEDAKKSNRELAGILEAVSNDMLQISGAVGNLASSLEPFNAGLSDSLSTLSDITGVLGNAAGAAASFYSGDIVGGITKTIQTIAGIFTIGAKSRESERKAMAELQAYQDSLIKGEIDYNELLRGRERTIKNINDLTAQQLKQQLELLDLQKHQALADEQRLLNIIQQQGQQVTGENAQKYGGFLGIGRKSKTVQDLAGLSDADYTQLEKLFTEGKLDEKTAKWFQELKSVHDELDSIGESAQQVADQLNQVLTGTTSQSIADSIKDGLAQGYNSAADFASNLQSLFTNAILSAFEANRIKPAMEQFYYDLASFNSDGLLDQGEIDQLTQVYNTTVDSLAQQYDQIKQIAGLADSNNATNNSLVGALKGMTEQSAELLAGQFGAQRLTLVQMMNISSQQLNQLVLISNYAADIPNIKAVLNQMYNNGIKIRA